MTVGEWFEKTKNERKRRNTKNIIKKNILIKRLRYFITITINREWKTPTIENVGKIQHSLKTLFDYYNIDYCLLAETHKDEINYHWHGFINCDQDQLYKFVYEGVCIKNKYGQQVYNFKPLEENYGFSNIIDMLEKENSSFNDAVVQKLVAYTTKYVSKKSNLKLMSNRTVRWLDRSISKLFFIFNELVVVR